MAMLPGKSHHLFRNYKLLSLGLSNIASIAVIEFCMVPQENFEAANFIYFGRTYRLNDLYRLKNNKIIFKAAKVTGAGVYNQG